MIVIGAPIGSDRARALAYDSDRDRWRLLPSYPLSANAASIAWTGRELIAWDYELRAASYDPRANEWRRLPKPPLNPGECPPATAVLDGTVFADFCWQAAILDPRSRSWTKVPHVPRTLDGPPVAADGVFYFAGSWPEGGSNTFWEYRP
jgi:hypothetical protein